MMTEHRDFASDWKAFRAEYIPSKGIQLPLLFFDTLNQLEHDNKQLRILELGSGCGDLSAFLSNERRHSVIGTDINEEGIQIARSKCPEATFVVTNVAGKNLVDDLTQCARISVKESFDFVIMQLLLSIVGGPAERQSTLFNAKKLCRPGGRIYVSASGISGNINKQYAKLYQDDKKLTGEQYSYFSRHSDSGNILYTTHHFRQDELKELLTAVGFEEVNIQQVKEHSSRRLNEAAYFLYATAICPLQVSI
jgi:2-polyprenyl-3-methyl-5-hydroxy-6-metoxy-1,4-benzoquinol methylase